EPKPRRPAMSEPEVGDQPSKIKHQCAMSLREWRRQKSIAKKQYCHSFPGGIRMGRKEGKTQPHQTWSQLLGSPARFSGIRSESSLWTRLTARGNSVYSASGAESAELLPCVSLGAATAFESSGPGIGAKANNFMKKRTARYADDKGEIIGELHRIKDELPSIDELAGKSGRQTKITLALDNDALS